MKKKISFKYYYLQKSLIGKYPNKEIERELAGLLFEDRKDSMVFPMSVRVTFDRKSTMLEVYPDKIGSIPSSLNKEQGEHILASIEQGEINPYKEMIEEIEFLIKYEYELLGGIDYTLKGFKERCANIYWNPITLLEDLPKEVMNTSLLKPEIFTPLFGDLVEKGFKIDRLLRVARSINPECLSLLNEDHIMAYLLMEIVESDSEVTAIDWLEGARESYYKFVSDSKESKRMLEKFSDMEVSKMLGYKSDKKEAYVVYFDNIIERQVKENIAFNFKSTNRNSSRISRKR